MVNSFHSILAFKKSKHTIDACINHPFNQEMKAGSLPGVKFHYFLEQDKLFLKSFGEALENIAQNVDDRFSEIFHTHSKHCFEAEKSILKNRINFYPKSEVTLATFSLNSFLIEKSLNKSPAIGIAAVLPCFKVYSDVGVNLGMNLLPSNPYYSWIEGYNRDSFRKSVEEMIDIFNKIAEESSEEIRQEMLSVYSLGCILEWHFWDQAYHQKPVDHFLLEKNCNETLV